MLISIVNNIATVRCDKCETVTDHDISDVTCTFLPEFGEYENLHLHCSNCPTTEGFNMNLPLDETQDEIPTYEMPEEEEIQRYYVRLSMRMVREDFKNNV